MDKDTNQKIKDELKNNDVWKKSNTAIKLDLIFLIKK